MLEQIENCASKNKQQYISLPSDNSRPFIEFLRYKITESIRREYAVLDEIQKIAIPKDAYRILPGDDVIAYLGLGKDASTSICNSIRLYFKANDIKKPVYHFHNFTSLDMMPNTLPFNLLAAALYDSVFLKYKHEIQWKFIYGIRDVVGRAISAHFDRMFPKIGYDKKELVSDMQKFFPVIKHFLTKTTERVTGINCYEYPFDVNAGYSIIKKDNMQILLYKFENINMFVVEAFEKFINAQINLSKNNITDDRRISYAGESIKSAYSRAKKEFCIPREVADDLYTHKSVTHFYSQEEIESFYRKWVNESLTKKDWEEGKW